MGLHSMDPYLLIILNLIFLPSIRCFYENESKSVVNLINAQSDQQNVELFTVPSTHNRHSVSNNDSNNFGARKGLKKKIKHKVKIRPKSRVDTFKYKSNDLNFKPSKQIPLKP